VVDLTEFDFYVMDCYRQLAEGKVAETLADELIRKCTDFDGTERAPMRTVEDAVHQSEPYRTAQVPAYARYGQP
jgi:hypothetical protein